MSYYYYLDISLEFHKDFDRRDITHAFFKKHVMQAVKTLFGEIGASVTVDILKYNPDTRRAILRVPAEFYVKLHSSLTLCGEYEANMSTCERLGPNGKDIVIFATAEDHKIPSTVTLPEPEPSPGLILPNGDINWNCPCLGEAEPKGSDCYEKFKTMQECMEQFPSLYNKDLSDDNEIAEALEKSEQESQKTKEVEKENSSEKAK
ncbi:uncharacterized protein CBL_04321 [Carabus blaptoides fortunei]